MKTHRRTVLKGLAATGALAGQHLAAATPKVRPNILVILADDMGYADVGCFGSRHIRTPYIDGLATQGVKLTDCYANSPVCSPTRLSMITGRYNVAFRTGLVEPFSAGPWGDSAVPANYPTLPAVMRDAGYRTSLIGKWHLGESEAASPLNHGYQEFFGFLGGAIDYFSHEYIGRPALRKDAQAETRPGYMTTLLADEAIRSLGRHAAAREPFLMSLYFNAPHWPWEGPEDFALNNPGADYSGGSLETYARMTESLDTNIGRVLRALDTLGLAQDTLVVFTSDNGGERYSEVWPFQGMKGYLLEGGIRVPGIVRFPGRIPAGSISTQMAITMDWAPTFLDAAGISPARGQTLDGISLLPALTSARTVSRSLFWRFQGHRQRAARIGNWKYYRLEDDEFLFDLSEDTMERANKALVAPETLARLKTAWETWNSGMVTDDSIQGFCSSPHNLAGALPMGEGSNCKVGRAPPRAGN